MQLEKRVRICETHLQQLCRHQGDPSGNRAEISLQPVVQTAMRHLCPSSPCKAMLEQKSSLRGPHSEAGCWVGLWIRGESTPRCSRFAGETYDPERDLYWSSLFLKGCTLWKGHTLEQFENWRTHTGEVHGGLFPVDGTPHWNRGRIRINLSLRRKQQQRLTAASIPGPFAAAGGRK